MFGLPAHMKDVVISPKAPLFLYDPTRRSLLGLFQAVTPLTENLDPQAFIDWSDPANRNRGTATSALPLQVSFSVVVECPPVFVDDPELVKGW
jgi:hypothetical protein